MKKVLCLIFGFSFLQGCVEPFEAESLAFENVIVIDARITDEFKRHKVNLKRAYPFERESFEVERNASVQINDDLGNTFNFQESTPGNYVSVSEFAAQPNTGYRLIVTTSDGKSYESETTVTPTSIPIKEVNADIVFNDSGEEGVRISLTNETTDIAAKYFRFQYEETYKIVAPYYSPLEFDIIDSIFFGPGDFDSIEIGLKPRTEEARVCYNTLSSADIALNDTEGNIDNEITNRPIRFLKSDDFKISHRYSILIKQFGLTQDAHSYYTNLNDFNSSESVFTETQPGFLEGNIKAVGTDELVLGYFEVAALNQRRYFFSYEDFFPNRDLPPHIINCELSSSPQLIRFAPHVGPNYVADSGVLISPLLDGIQAGVFAYFEINEDYETPLNDPNDLPSDLEIGPYFVKATACVDCRVLGSNVKPNFWID
ncbi:DUF4249 domain-containing protein [Maribacter sp. 2308TA10-17]|uniref:DUF4249 domain-containing protein n=1 Tax=Maribacter sp. 2308TA10-17 TaxID=3386276 RepID=UPI0039BCCD33